MECMSERVHATRGRRGLQHCPKAGEQNNKPAQRQTATRAQRPRVCGVRQGLQVHACWPRPGKHRHSEGKGNTAQSSSSWAAAMAEGAAAQRAVEGPAPLPGGTAMPPPPPPPPAVPSSQSTGERSCMHVGRRAVGLGQAILLRRTETGETVLALTPRAAPSWTHGVRPSAVTQVQAPHTLSRARWGCLGLGGRRQPARCRRAGPRGRGVRLTAPWPWPLLRGPWP